MEVNIFSLEAGLFWTSFAVTVAVLVGIAGEFFFKPFGSEIVHFLIDP